MKEGSIPDLSPWLIDGHLLPVSLYLYMCLCVQISLFLRTPVVLDWSPLKWYYFNLITSLKTLFPNSVTFWGTGQIQHMNLGGRATIQPMTLADKIISFKKKNHNDNHKTSNLGSSSMNGLFLNSGARRKCRFLIGPFVTCPLPRIVTCHHASVPTKLFDLFVFRSEPAVLASTSEIHSICCIFSTANSDAKMS